MENTKKKSLSSPQVLSSLKYIQASKVSILLLNLHMLLKLEGSLVTAVCLPKCNCLPTPGRVELKLLN